MLPTEFSARFDRYLPDLAKGEPKKLLTPPAEPPPEMKEIVEQYLIRVPCRDERQGSVCGGKGWSAPAARLNAVYHYPIERVVACERPLNVQ